MSNRQELSGKSGFTMIEVVITLAVVAILAAILVPIITQNIQSARLARARSDVNTLGKAIMQFHQDMGLWPVVKQGAGNMQLLFGDTDATHDGVPDNSSIPAGWNAIPADSRLSLAYNLINNSNNYSQVQAVQGVSWNGPYLSAVNLDPWGNPYLVNARWLWDGGTGIVHVLCAGPGRPASVETPFDNIPPNTSDDIVFRIQ